MASFWGVGARRPALDFCLEGALAYTGWSNEEHTPSCLEQLFERREDDAPTQQLDLCVRCHHEPSVPASEARSSRARCSSRRLS